MSTKEKYSQKEVNYRAGTVDRRCGLCTMFRRPDSCTAVRGVISAKALCDIYKRIKRHGH